MRYLVPSLLAYLLLSFLVISCSGEQRTRLSVTPTSYGKADNILVVMDDYSWGTVIGDTFRHNFEALYPVTPQPEPVYDLIHKKPKTFSEGKIFKTHRSVLIVGALDDIDNPASELIRKTLGEKNIRRAKKESNYRIAIHKNRWAQGQTVIYWFAPDRNELLKTVAKDYQRVMNEFNKADTDMFIHQVYLPGENTKARVAMEKEFKVTLKVPQEYIVAHRDSVAIWMRRETNEISSNIFMYVLPMSDSTTLTPEHHKYYRNALTKSYFSTHIEDSYMQIDDRILPIYYNEMQFDQKPALQARGLWGMVNDFMGGSFVTYMIKDEENQRIILLDGFVHAPGKRKRPELRKLDMIFSTFQTL